jgi:hypothetical protein
MINQRRASSYQSFKSTEASSEDEIMPAPKLKPTIMILGRVYKVPEFANRIYMHFWFWDSFITYAKFILAFVLLMAIITGLFHASPAY